MDCSLPGSSLHGILQERMLEWVAIPFSRRSTWPRDWTWVSHIAGRFFTIWANREALLDVRAGQWKRLSAEELMPSSSGAGEVSWESLGQQDQTSQSKRKSTLNIHWKDWCWSWSSSTLVTWCKELTHWKRLWCYERVRARGEGYHRRWDGRMASLTHWTCVWVNSGRWWRTGKPDELQSMG